MTEFMKSDKALDKDINRAETFEDIRSLLENATSRSGIADRDPVSGRFILRDPLTPAAQTVAPEDEQITKTEVIGGQEFTFTGTALEVEQRITDAYKVAEAVKTAEPPATPRSVRAKTQAEIARDIFDRNELDMQLHAGAISTTDYLERSGAFADYLTAKGFDVEAAAGKQFEQSWQQATEMFLQTTPEGQSWKGGQKNRDLIGNLILSHDLVDAEDKVAALRAVAKEMREKGLEFEGDYTPEQMVEMTDKAGSPQEILEAWKEAHQGDPEVANQEFIRLHSGGRFFNK